MITKKEGWALARSMLNKGKGYILSPDETKLVHDEILSRHPEYEDKKIGGVSGFAVAPISAQVCCLAIIRDDGHLVHFSYIECLADADSIPESDVSMVSQKSIPVKEEPIGLDESDDWTIEY